MNIGDQIQTIQKVSQSTQLTIGYMKNPDKIYYNEMDDVLIRNLEQQGTRVEQFEIDEVYFSIGNEGSIEVFLNGRKVLWDGFLSYGYMSKLHFEAYTYIISALHSAGIPCLHTPEAEKVLNNKFEQSLRFVKAGINVPTTHIGFGINSFKKIAEENYTENSILKHLDDYGGDGVSKFDNKDHIIYQASKLLWKNEYCIFQKYVPDSLGKSIRVLCLDGKTVAIAQYEDKTNNFRSNHSFGYENFSLNSLMDSEDFNKYAQIGEDAIQSIGNLTIGGVDILDSKVLGCVVLEVNGWPDIYDIGTSTKLDIFQMFIQAFVKKCQLKKCNS